MKELLAILFLNSITAGDETYSKSQVESNWIGNEAATTEEILNAESRLNIELPKDYKEMLYVSNGFPTSNWRVEPSFQKVSEIGYYRDFEHSVIEEWSKLGDLQETVNDLKRAIIVAGKDDEQQFLLSPPSETNGSWKYWKFAMWIPGEQQYDSLAEYFESINEFLEGVINEKKN